MIICEIGFEGKKIIISSFDTLFMKEKSNFMKEFECIILIDFFITLLIKGKNIL